MEKPVNLSSAAWQLIAQHIEEHVGDCLIAAGLLNRADVLQGMTVEIPLADGVDACVIDSVSAKAIVAQEAHIRVKRLGDKKEYLVPRALLIQAIREGDGLDYIERLTIAAP